MPIDRSMTTTQAKYGIYGSWTTYIIFFAIAVLSLLLIVLTDLPRVLLVIIFTSSAILLVLLIAIPQLLFGRVRMEIVRNVVTTGVIRQKDRVLDIGTGRGFLAVEIARRVRGCYVVGIDLWDAPAGGEIHKGFVLGNAKKSAEKNAELEGVSDRVEFRQADARDMPFESGSFDIAVSSLVLHQIVYSPNGQRVLEEIYRVLKPEGRLVVVDIIIGRRIIRKLQELGFTEIIIKKIKNLGPFSFLLKILSSIKAT